MNKLEIFIGYVSLLSLYSVYLYSFITWDGEYGDASLVISTYMLIGIVIAVPLLLGSSLMNHFKYGTPIIFTKF